jgi:hypothetical protein
MKKYLLMTLTALSVVFFSGCGSNDMDTDSNETNATALITLSVVTPAGGVYAIDKADHDYDVVLKVTQGTTLLSDKVIKIGTTNFMGSFGETQAKTDGTGKATFVYRSPASVSSSTSFDVTFSLEENTTISAKITFKFKAGGTTPPVQGVDKINYGIVFQPQNNAYNLGLGMQKAAKVQLVDSDTGKAIDRSRVHTISVMSKDTTVLKLAQENGGMPAEKVSLTNDNNVSVLLVADEHNSGLAPLLVKITYVNLNGIEKSIEQTFSVTVLTGPPTAFSINSAGISYNFKTKQFEHKFLIQAVDNSGNPIASEGIINVSAMAGFAKDANGREMLYGRYANQNDGISATLSSAGGKGQIQIAGIAPYDSAHVNVKRAFVAVYGTVDTYEANGKWNIESILGNDTLSFGNQYLGGDYTGLGMAVGYNYRDKFCSSGYEESVVIVDSTDGTYTLGKDGKAFVTLKFDAYMIGKRTAVLVNMIGYDPVTNQLKRSGEVHFTTEHFIKDLRGKTLKVPKGSTDIVRAIYGVIDTGTDDEYYLRNSLFSCEIELNGASIVPGSPVVRNDPKSCDFGGRAFYGFHLSADKNDTDGTITFTKCQVNSEPSF